MIVPLSFLRSWAEWLQSSSRSQNFEVQCSVGSELCVEGADALLCHPEDDEDAVQSDLRHLPELEVVDQEVAGLLHILESSEIRQVGDEDDGWEDLVVRELAANRSLRKVESWTRSSER
jgi:hypothetical protein